MASLISVTASGHYPFSACLHYRQCKYFREQENEHFGFINSFGERERQSLSHGTKKTVPKVIWRQLSDEFPDECRLSIYQPFMHLDARRKVVSGADILEARFVQGQDVLGYLRS